MKDLSTAEELIGEKSAEFRTAPQQVTLKALRAPVNGTVQQLAVFGSRATVEPGQKLMAIVPDGQSLVVEAMVANKDIGFVRAGQIVKLKVAAFSFTRYGLVSGEVVGVSRDAIDDTLRTGGDGAGRDQGSSGGDVAKRSDFDGGEGSSYVARIILDRDFMTIDGRQTSLEPGMSVTAEILTGRRRVISYLLSPISRGLQDAAQER